jgi:hypothetical protein
VFQILLDVQLPLCVYKKLLNMPVGLEDLRKVDPPVGASLQALLDYKGDDVEVRGWRVGGERGEHGAALVGCGCACCAVRSAGWVKPAR